MGRKTERATRWVDKSLDDNGLNQIGVSRQPPTPHGKPKRSGAHTLRRMKQRGNELVVDKK